MAKRRSQPVHKKFYETWWFWVLMVIVFYGLLGVFVPADSSCETENAQIIIYRQNALDLCTYTNTLTELINEYRNYLEIATDYQPTGEDYELFDCTQFE